MWGEFCIDPGLIQVVMMLDYCMITVYKEDERKSTIHKLCLMLLQWKCFIMEAVGVRLISENCNWLI